MDQAEKDYIDYKLLHEVYGGDVERQRRDDERSKRESLSFDQLLEAAEILPELTVQGKQAIKTMLGFLPDDFITLAHEPYIRGVINSFKMGMLTKQQFYNSIEDSVIPMRNAFVFYHNDIAYPQRIYTEYNALPAYQKSAALARTSKFLGYEPDIGASIAAILSLATTMFRDTTIFPEYLTPADYQVIQIIKYREVLLSKGKDTADKSAMPRLAELNLDAFPPTPCN